LSYPVIELSVYWLIYIKYTPAPLTSKMVVILHIAIESTEGAGHIYLQDLSRLPQ
jgi:hypothetical protein